MCVSLSVCVPCYFSLSYFISQWLFGSIELHDQFAKLWKEEFQLSVDLYVLRKFPMPFCVVLFLRLASLCLFVIRVHQAYFAFSISVCIKLDASAIAWVYYSHQSRQYPVFYVKRRNKSIIKLLGA